MGTFRAVKIVYRKSFDTQRPFDREFSGIQKFEPISRSHEGFIDILHIGKNEPEGYFYYIMELGDDEKTDQIIDPAAYRPRTLGCEPLARKRLEFDECLSLALSLTDALAHLHKSGLVHRDIKPANIIFINRRPKLADIGLVAQMNEPLSVVGTHGFIPPEGPGNPRADLYSLGKVLYEISTGNDRNDFPEFPDCLGELEDSDRFLEFNEIVIRACCPDVRGRYQSAEQMYAELVVIQGGRSVKRLHLLEKRLNRLKRASVPMLALLLVAALLGFSFYRERKMGFEQRQRQIGSKLALSTVAVDKGDFLGALPLLDEAIRLESHDPDRLRDLRLAFGSTLEQCPKIVQIWSNRRPIRFCEFNSDGSQLLQAVMEGQVRVYDVSSGAPVSPPMGQETLLETGSFSPDGRLIVTASQDHTASVWDAVTGERKLQMVFPRRAMMARFSPDGQRFAVACQDDCARICSTFSKTNLLILPHPGSLRFALWSPDGRMILTGGTDGTARIWDAITGQPIGNPMRHPSWVLSGAFSPDSKRIVTGCFDRRARTWDLATGKESAAEMYHGDGVSSVAFSPDGQYVATASWDSTARLWDAMTGLPLRQNHILRHSARVFHLAFSPDGRRLATCCLDGTVRVWDLAAMVIAPQAMEFSSAAAPPFWSLTDNSGGTSKHGLPRDSSPRIHYKNDARFAVLENSNGKSGGREFQVWDVPARVAISPMVSNSAWTNAVISDDGKFLAEIGATNFILYDLRTAAPRLKVEAENPIQTAAFSRDQRLVMFGSGSRARVLEILTGRELFAPLKHGAAISAGDFSPDHRFLATACVDDSLNELYAQIWKLDSGRPIGPALKHRDGVIRIAFSPDSKRVVTASEDFTAIIWDPQTGRPLAPPLRHEDQVYDAQFSPNGGWIVTVCRDKTVRVWNAATGDPITPPLRHPFVLRRAAFRDQFHIVVTDSRGQAWIWTLPSNQRPAEEIQRLASFLTADLNGATRGDFSTAWQQLRALHPTDFSVAEEQVRLWHQREAFAAKEDSNWEAFSLHRTHLRPKE